MPPMYNPQESMDTYLLAALSALERGDTNAGIADLVRALQEMSCRLDAIEAKVGVSYAE